MIGIKMGVQTSGHNRRPTDGNTNEVEPCKYNRSCKNGARGRRYDGNYEYDGKKKLESNKLHHAFARLCGCDKYLKLDVINIFK